MPLNYEENDGEFDSYTPYIVGYTVPAQTYVDYHGALPADEDAADHYTVYQRIINIF